MDSRYLEKIVSSSCASTTVTRNYSSCSSNWCWRKNRRNIAVRESNGKRWVWPSKTHTVITWRNSTWLWWYSTRTFWLDISSDFAHCGWLEEYHQFLTVRILHIVLILIICFTLFPGRDRSIISTTKSSVTWLNKITREYLLSWMRAAWTLERSPTR